MNLKNKIVVITGGTKGLGKYYVKKFIEKGAKVVATYGYDEKAAKKMINEIDSANCHVIKCDVGDSEDVKMFWEIFDKLHNHLDILINNAGVFNNEIARKMKNINWENVINVNLNGTFFNTKYGMRRMYKRGFGRIINISSIQAHQGVIGASNYSASKAGIEGFTKSIAKEVAKHNITVNSLALGFIEEGMLLRLPEKIKNSILKTIPIDRFGKPEEVFEAIEFISGEKSSYITGQTIHINGGCYI